MSGYVIDPYLLTPYLLGGSMADLTPAQYILEDKTTRAGDALTKVAEGDAIASVKALSGLVAKDPSDNLVYIKANAAGEILVNTEGADKTCLYDYGTATGSATDVTVATITLTASKSYEDVSFVFSCFRNAVFSIVQNDNATETTLSTVLVGNSDFTEHGQIHCFEFTAGATGTQELLVKAKNLQSSALSDFYATISINELV